MTPCARNLSLTSCEIARTSALVAAIIRFLTPGFSDSASCHASTTAETVWLGPSNWPTRPRPAKAVSPASASPFPNARMASRAHGSRCRWIVSTDCTGRAAATSRNPAGVIVSTDLIAMIGAEGVAGSNDETGCAACAFLHWSATSRQWRVNSCSLNSIQRGTWIRRWRAFSAIEANARPRSARSFSNARSTMRSAVRLRSRPISDRRPRTARTSRRRNRAALTILSKWRANLAVASAIARDRSAAIAAFVSRAV